MTPRFRIPGRTLLAFAALSCLCLPVLAVAGPSVVHFFADFNEVDTSAPGPKDFSAEGGNATVNGPQHIFNQVFPATGEGVIEIEENSGAIASELECLLDEPSTGNRVDVSFLLRIVGDPSDLIVRFDDSGDTGMLDLEFDDSGNMIVAGLSAPLPLGTGEDQVHVKMTLQSHAMAPDTWKLTVTGPTESTQLSGHLVTPSGSVALGSVHFIREAGSEGGRLQLDNVLVISEQGGYTDLIPNVMVRQ